MIGVEAIRSAINVVLPSFRSTCDRVHCLGDTVRPSSFVAVFWQFFSSNTPLILYNVHYRWCIGSQGNWWIKYLVHPKIRKPKPCCWCLRLWSLWKDFTYCSPISWPLIWLRSEVMELCFIHRHIFTQKLLLVVLKQLQTTLWIVDAFLFFNVCEQTQRLLWTQFSHWQNAKWCIHCFLISSNPLLSYARSTKRSL